MNQGLDRSGLLRFNRAARFCMNLTREGFMAYVVNLNSKGAVFTAPICYWMIIRIVW